MKQFIPFLLCCMAVFAACTRSDEMTAPIDTSGGNRLVAVIDDLSKTFIDDLDVPGTHKVKWAEGDALSINGTAVPDLQIAPDGLSAVVDAAGLEAPYRAFYPAAAVQEGSFIRAHVVAPGDTVGYKSADGNWYDYLQADFPAVQHFTPGTFDAASSFMASSVEDNQLVFKPLTAFLKITVTGNVENIRRIVITNGRSKSGMAGTYKYVFKNDNVVSQTLSNEDVQQNITVDCGEDGVPAGTTVLAVVPARTYSEGLIVTVETVDGYFNSIKSSPLALLDGQGTILTVPVEYTGTGERGYISTANEWNLFASDVNKGNSLDRWLVDGVVKLKNHISADDLDRITAPWTYVLDGCDCAIIQEAANGPLFTTVDGGTVKNLTLYGQIGDNVEDASTPGYVSLVQIVKGGGLISNIGNHMNMLAMVQTKQHIAMAGICRQILSGTIEDCYNAGEISASYPAATTVNCYAAGIVALIGTLSPSAPALEGPVLIQNCQNYAKVHTENTTTSAAYPMHYNALGGIVSWIAYDKGEYSATLYNCSNNAEVSTDRGKHGPNLSFAAVGGIVGCAYFPNSSFTYSNNGKDYGVPVGRSFACPYGCKLWPTGSGSEAHKDGVFFRLEKCSNSGILYNAAPSNSAVASSTLRMKQYTGGIAGVAIGEVDRHAQIVDCSSTGIVDGGSEYSRSSYQSVNAGLVGLAGALDVSGCEVGTATTALQIGRSFNTFANGGLFGLMPIACNVSDCTLNFLLTAVGSGHDTMPYFAALAAMVKGGSSNQGGYLKDADDPTLYYAGSSFKNVLVKGQIDHGKTWDTITPVGLMVTNLNDWLFCSYDKADTDVQAFDMSGTGYWF